eukprot:jgi/Mesvir1/18379/Mv14262-RA.1
MVKGKEKAVLAAPDSDNADSQDDSIDDGSEGYEDDESENARSWDDVDDGDDDDESGGEDASESDLVEEKDDESLLERGSHPLGVQPTGNMWLREDLRECEACRQLGLGCLATLKDDLLVTLLGYMGARELAVLACTSKVLYAFCYHEELWRELVIDTFGDEGFTFVATWRETYASEASRWANPHPSVPHSGEAPPGPLPGKARNGPPVASPSRNGPLANGMTNGHPAHAASGQPAHAANGQTADAANGPLALAARGRPALGANYHPVRANGHPVRARIQVPHLFSDVLFQPWRCASALFRPEWLATVRIDQRAASSLSAAQFVDLFERRNKPVLIQGDPGWGCASLGGWSREDLLGACGEARFACGPVELTLSQYLSYADSVQEEQPVYLFDSKFATKAPALASAYTVPPYFSDDLFRLLGEEDRPDYRWLIVGPRRSGSRFHVDPNGTSAWNMCLRGRKKWVMYPPSQPPPGVFPSPDGAEVASPVSVYEWFLNFYKPGEAPVEFVADVGDVVFVPSGWWHCVYNLDDGDNIAVTQNLCSPATLHRVAKFLKERPEQISGLKKEVDRDAFVRSFFARLEEERPELAEGVSKGLCWGGMGKPSLWAAPDIKQEFKFGFGAN